MIPSVSTVRGNRPGSGSENGRILLGAIFILGLALRFRQYFFNRSLWLDEASLALNLMNRSFAGFFLPLEFQQAAPPLFMVASKIAVLLLGHHELAFRLVPFLAGIAGLVIFFKVSPHLVDRRALPAAFFLLAASEWHIYYSSEFKPYSMDVFASVLILAIGLKMLAGRTGISRAMALGVAGAVLPWISFPSVFLLAGAGSSALILSALRRMPRQFIAAGVTVAIWGASVFLLYWTLLHGYSANPHLRGYWQREGAFLSEFFFSMGSAGSVIQMIGRLFRHPAGFFFPGAAVAVVILGSVTLYRARKNSFYCLISFLPFLIAANLLYQYPISKRLMLFALPVIYLLVGEGLASLKNLGGRRIAYIFAGLLLFYPAFTAACNFFHPWDRQPMKPALHHIRSHWQPGDHLYVYRGGLRPFQIYGAGYGFDDENSTIGTRFFREDVSVLSPDFQAMASKKRVWFLICHDIELEGMDKRPVFLAHMRQTAKLLNSYRINDTSAYLFEFP